jgi:hypothetical protein
VHWLARLVRDLAGEGTVLTDGGGGLVITSFSGRPVEPPMTLALAGPQFTAHLEALAADSADAFPEVDPVTAAYRLFLVHLDETIITRAVPGSRITVTLGRWAVDPERPPDPLPDLDPDAEYVWASEPPGSRRRLR